MCKISIVRFVLKHSIMLILYQHSLYNWSKSWSKKNTQNKDVLFLEMEVVYAMHRSKCSLTPRIWYLLSRDEFYRICCTFRFTLKQGC
jgi:hypothetical protein